MPTGIELATGYVSLVTETQGITKAVNDVLGKAEQQAQVSGKNMGQKLGGSFNSAIQGIGVGPLAALGLGVGGIGAAFVGATKAAADFQTTQTRLVTSAGESVGNLKGVSAGLLSMAGQVGESANALSVGMYTVESAGYHGAAGLLVMKAAAQGAKMEGADLKTVADAVSTAMTDYHLPASQAATVTSQLVTAVGQGKTNMQDFSSSLHSITPLAASVGISLADVTGSLAEMTSHGMSADQASQNLADTLRHLITPTGPMRAELAQIGMTASDVSDALGKNGLSGTLDMLSEKVLSKMGPDGKMMLDMFNSSKDAANNVDVAMKGLPASMQGMAQGMKDGTLSAAEWRAAVKDLPDNQKALASGFEEIYNKAHGFTDMIKNGSPQAQNYTQAIKALTGDATGLNTTLMLTGENAASTANNVKLVSQATADASGNVKGWGEIQGTFNQQFSEFVDGLGAAGIRIGTKLLPPLTTVVKVMGDGVRSFADGQGVLAGVAHAGDDAVKTFTGLPEPIKLAVAALAAAKVVSMAFGTEIGGVATKVKAFGTGFREEMELQRTLAASTGVEISRYGSAIATLEARSPAIGGVTDAYRRVSGAANDLAIAQKATGLATDGMVGQLRIGAGSAIDFGGKVGGVAAAGVKGLSTAVGGVVNALGGPWVLGISAAVGLLGASMESASSAKSAHEALTAAVTAGAKAQAAFGDAVALANGQLSDQAMAAGSAAVKASLSQITTLGERGHTSIENLGHAIDDVTLNVLGGNNAWEKQYDQVSANIERNNALHAVMDALKIDMDGLGRIVTQGGPAYDDLIRRFQGMGQAGKDVAANLQEVHPQLQGIADAARNATPGFFTLEQAVKTLADTSSTVPDKLQAMKSALDIMSGKPVAATEAMAAYNKVVRDTAAATQDAWDQTKGWGAQLLDQSGHIDTTSENGGKLLDQLDKIRDATASAALAGNDMAPVWQKNQQQFQDLATATGLTVDQVQNLATQIGLVPRDITILTKLQGADDAKQKLVVIEELLKANANGVDIPVKDLGGKEVEDQLRNVGVKIDDVNGKPGIVHVSSNDLDTALNKLQQIVEAPNPTKTVTVKWVDDLTHSYLGTQQHDQGLTGPGAPILPGINPAPRADGGIDNLPGSATIQSPKTGLVQWAEPETGGEAFIPLAQSKRSRSADILGQVAQMFGYKLESYATGGIRKQQSPEAISNAMATILHKQWPELQLTSGFRPGDTGYHGAGDAGDFSNGSGNTPQMDAAANYIADNWPQSLELIHGGGFDRNIKNGADAGNGESIFGAATMAEHINHVHWAMDKPPSASAGARGGNRNDGLAHADTRTDRERVIDAIVAEGRRRNLPDKAISIAIATALVESNASVLANPNDPDSLNVPHSGTGSDHDSVGPFQQRPSWGSVQQRMDPTTSAGLFYDRLVQQPYMKMDAGAAAQAVQVSAFPERYAQRMKEADDLLKASSGRASGENKYYEAPAPQAPELTSSLNSEQIKLREDERAVRDANLKRNEVYNNAAATKDERDAADDALQTAINNLAEEKRNPSGKGHVQTASELGQNAIEKIADVGKAFFVGEMDDALGVLGLSGGIQGVVGAGINIGLSQIKLPTPAATPEQNKQNQNWLDDLINRIAHPGTAPKLKDIGVYDDGGWLMPGQLAANLSGSAEPMPVFNGEQWGNISAIANGAGVGVAPPSTVIHNHNEDFSVNVDRPGASIQEIQRHIQMNQRERSLSYVGR